MSEDKSVKVTRRVILHGGAALGAAGLAAAGIATRAAAQDDKIDQKSVLYQDHPKNGQECDLCINFQPPNACKVVAGDISPKGWCGVFAPKA